MIFEPVHICLQGVGTFFFFFFFLSVVKLNFLGCCLRTILHSEDTWELQANCFSTITRKQNQHFQPSKTIVINNLLISTHTRLALVIWYFVIFILFFYLGLCVSIYIVNHLVPYLTYFINILCVNCITIIVLDPIDYWDDMHVFLFFFCQAV